VAPDRGRAARGPALPGRRALKILFAFVGTQGHFEPLAPIASAAVAAGHEVRFACQQRMAAAVAARGFEVSVTGPPGRVAQRRPIAEPDQDKEDRQLREVFAGGLARERVASLGELFAQWPPEVVVHDESDYGAPLAAELRGMPHVSVEINAAGSFFRAELLAEPLDALRAELGLPPDPEMRAPARHLVLSPFPPSLRHPDFPLPDTGHAFRLGRAPLASGDAVYFTLGTVFNLESGDLFTRVLSGLAGRRAIVTVGSAIDPAELGPPPPGVRIERFVAQADVLPDCCAVISHGGSGSIVGALAHGLPSVLLAMGADQLHNAARCEAVGVARLLHPVRATSGDVAAALDAVIGGSSYRAAAVRFHHEIAGLPGPSRAVELIEGL
jgi:UDP:flavonoid glycosyltransferase YjiC (YdhE family)